MTQNSRQDFKPKTAEDPAAVKTKLLDPGPYGMWLALGVCVAFAYIHGIVPAAGSAIIYKAVFVGLLLLPLLLVLWAFRLVFGLRAFGYVATGVFVVCWLAWAYIENTAQISPRTERAEFQAVVQKLAASYDHLVQEIAPK